MTESTDYPLHVHELVEAEANVGRLATALRTLADSVEGAWPYLASTPPMVAARAALAKAEKRS